MKANILIVDDEEGMRYTLRSFLSDEGHRVFTAEGYDEALSVLSEVDLDLIFSDIVLGGRTGIDVLRAAKEHKPTCPVIMITGYPDVGTASEAVRLGAFDYISKPVVQKTLLHSAGKALQHKARIDMQEKCRSNLETLFHRSRDAIISVDQEQIVLELNESAKTICSLSSEAVGHSLGSIGLRCGGKCLEVLREANDVKRIIREHRIECRHEERGAQVVNLSIYPLVDDRDAFSGAVMVIKDETGGAELDENRRQRCRIHNIVGRSDKMQSIYDLIEPLRDVQTTVLIIGESGTGKELIAEALHHGGKRCLKPFVKVNCGAITDSLLESELFGHVKGAFTGATGDKIGRFQRAHGGTIFLDEIGNISPRMQLSLLRVLQEREIERVGDATPVRVDVRVIAATNQNLMEKIRQGEFREDLYYRLNVMKIAVPPLRERMEDIALLVEHFLKKFNEKLGRDILAVSDEVLEVFTAYSWPGNVRELEHAMEHAFILCRQKIITCAHLPSELSQSNDSREKEETSRAAFSGKTDQHAILKALQAASWNKAKAARILGISRRTIFRKVREYNLVEHHTPCRL